MEQNLEIVKKNMKKAQEWMNNKVYEIRQIEELLRNYEFEPLESILKIESWLCEQDSNKNFLNIKINSKGSDFY